MAEDKKTPPKPAKPQKAKPVKEAPKAKAEVVVVAPAATETPEMKAHLDRLEDLANIDLDALADLDTADLRKKMLQGIYLLNHVLFSQAGFEFKRIQTLRSLIGKVETEIFDEQKFQQLSESEKLRLYRMMMGNMAGSLDFMTNLHKSVSLGVEAVNSIDRIKADKGFMAGAPEDEVKDEVDNIRAAIMEKIANKLKDPNARALPAEAKGKSPVKPKKPKKKKPKPKPKPKPKTQTPPASVPKGEGGTS